MIPYFRFDEFSIGPLNIYVWGAMVAAGLLTAVFAARFIARRRNLDDGVVVDLSVWVMLAALIIGRLFHVIAYGLDSAIADPLSIFRIWEGGMSSFGGYIGAALGIWLFSRKFKGVLRPHLEIAAFVMPLGYGIGRLGCFFIHDHPGVLSGSFLAVTFPAGARLDHGLLLSLFGFLMFGVFLVMSRKFKVGEDRWLYVPVLLMVYGLVRFGLGFLRAWDISSADPRYFWLTPGQYGAVILVAVGAWIAIKNMKYGKTEKQS
jgi:phosphatidylglycerol:prolipoprotein diacylglycerol transferase